MHEEDIEGLISRGDAESDTEDDGCRIALSKVSYRSYQLNHKAISSKLSLPRRHYLQGKGVQGITVEQIGYSKKQCYRYVHQEYLPFIVVFLTDVLSIRPESKHRTLLILAVVARTAFLLGFELMLAKFVHYFFR